MSAHHWRHRALTSAVFAVGAPAAAFLTMTAASADDYEFTPDPTTFVPTQVDGYPPLVNVVTGTEAFNWLDTTNSLNTAADFFKGVDTETTIGSFTNDDFLDTGLGDVFLNQSGVPVLDIPTDTQFDLANFGGGWANEWVSIPSGIDAGTSDWLITPFGDVSLFGSLFADMANGF